MFALLLNQPSLGDKTRVFLGFHHQRLYKSWVYVVLNASLFVTQFVFEHGVDDGGYLRAVELTLSERFKTNILALLMKLRC